MVNADKLHKLDEPPPVGTDEEYRCIEQAAGIETPNHQFRHRLARRIERWARWEPNYSNVRPAALLKAVRQLKKDAVPLLRDLTYPTYTGDNQIELARAQAYESALLMLGVNDALDQQLQYLIDLADFHLDFLPSDQGGRPADVEFAVLIHSLAHFYRDETGKKPSVTWDEHHNRYSGAFLNFFQACCRAFAPRYAAKTNQALGKATQRALKKLPVGL